MRIMKVVWSTLSASALCGSVIWAQQSKPPANPQYPPSGTMTTGVNPGQEQTEPATTGLTQQPRSATLDTQALSGAQEYTPGSVGAVRSFLLPSLQLNAQGDTNSPSQAGRSKLVSRGIILGNLTLQRVRGQQQLYVSYSGGASYTNDPSIPIQYGSIHRLNFTQSFMGRRWGLTLSDDLLYLPESAFGYGGFGGLDSHGTALGFGSTLLNHPTLNNQFVPNQTILTGQGRRISNTSVAEVQYRVGTRSLITATGTYGALQFLDSGFINSRSWNLLAGYNYSLTRKDTVAFIYLHNLFQFGGTKLEVLGRGMQLAYGRRVTGRLALKLSAGPLINEVSTPGGGSLTRVFWSTQDSLNYDFRRTTFGVSFRRFTTSGSGLLLGTESNFAEMDLSERLTRTISGTLNFGHAYNKSLLGNIGGANSASAVESWQGGTVLSRQFGPNASLFLNYYFQWQTTGNPAGCTNIVCGVFVHRHVLGIGINWHAVPIKIG